MSKPVFTIIEEHDALMSEIEDLGGEITPELAAKLFINENELANKIRAYYFIIKTKEADINLIKDEKERLDDVKKTKENAIKQLKKAVNLAVETFGTLKPSGVKGLDLGDLKVWQKKTEALELLGEVDDPRFCYKDVSFNFGYSQYEEFMKYIEGTTFEADAHSKIVPDKDSIKQWRINNEETHKILRNKASEITNPECEFVPELLPDEEEIQREKDLKVILATELKHNSTVIFK
jgi:hypothetical protein